MKPIVRLSSRPLLLALALLSAVGGEATAQEAGGFRVEYGEASSAAFRALGEGMRSEGALDSVAAALNRWVRTPEPVTLATRECGEARAWYNTASRSVTLCYELVQALYEYQVSVTEDPEAHADDVATEAASAVTYVLLHQAGHALLDVLRVPPADAGDPEAAAGELANLAVLETGLLWVLPAVLSVQESAIDWEGVGDARVQRPFDDLACLAFGSDPGRFQPLADPGYLPPARVPGCEREHRETSAKWRRLLGDRLVRR
jgi:Putative metallopeptidase